MAWPLSSAAGFAGHAAKLWTLDDARSRACASCLGDWPLPEWLAREKIDLETSASHGSGSGGTFAKLQS